MWGRREVPLPAGELLAAGDYPGRHAQFQGCRPREATDAPRKWHLPHEYTDSTNRIQWVLEREGGRKEGRGEEGGGERKLGRESDGG